MTTEKNRPLIDEFLNEVNDIAGFLADFSTSKREALKWVRGEIARKKLHLTSKVSFGTRSPIEGDTPKSMSLESFHTTSVREWITRLEGNKSIDLAAKSTIIFIFELWEHKYRGKILIDDQLKNESDIFGDLRILRNSILHNKGIAASNASNLKLIRNFKPGDNININIDDVKNIIQHIHADFSRPFFLE